MLFSVGIDILIRRRVFFFLLKSLTSISGVLIFISKYDWITKSERIVVSLPSVISSG